MTATTAILGGMPPARFLQVHWQKKPLLVRQAIPGFRGIIDRDALLTLATRSDATSRLVVEHPRRRGRWERHDGPFGGLDAAMLPASHWTLLVHGLESLVPGGWELLRHFDFIPAARIDDLMVSYAADGGGVGPHDDRYDVFLLQGPGLRRWQISTQRDRQVDPAAAMRVLADFRAEEEWLLEPGDMLYLPPSVAHRGVAEGACFTYSIGFLAPSHRTLVESFFSYLAHDRIDPDALYEDPDLRVPRDPLEVGDAMIAKVAGVLGGVRWGAGDVAEFLARLLTMPRPHVRFTPPPRPLDEEAFARRLRGHGRLSMALPSRGLVRRGRAYLNGQAHRVDRSTLTLFRRLVGERQVGLPLSPTARGLALLHEAYRAGHMRVEARKPEKGS